MFYNNIKYFSLPSNLRSELTASQFKIIYLILDLCQIRHKNYPGQSIYVMPSERWIAQKIGISREWVSKSLQKLQEVGLIIITRRRKERGVWRTNLYRLGHVLWRCLKFTSYCFSSVFNHVNKSSHLVIEPSINNKKTTFSEISYNNKSPGLGDIITRITKKLGFED